jgi:hypothetical protein
MEATLSSWEEAGRLAPPFQYFFGGAILGFELRALHLKHCTT